MGPPSCQSRYHYLLLSSRPAIGADPGWRSIYIFDDSGAQPTNLSGFVTPNKMIFRSEPACAAVASTKVIDNVSDYISQSDEESSTESTTTEFFDKVSQGSSASSENKLLGETLAKSAAYIASSSVECGAFRLAWDPHASIPLAGSSSYKTKPPAFASGDVFINDVQFMTDGNQDPVMWCGPSSRATDVQFRPDVPCWRWFFEKWGTYVTESVYVIETSRRC